MCGTHVGSSVVVDGGLGQHRVVLQLRLAQRRSVARDHDQLGLARAKGCGVNHCQSFGIIMAGFEVSEVRKRFKRARNLPLRVDL